jgi:hypothetical protein
MKEEGPNSNNNNKKSDNDEKKSKPLLYRNDNFTNTENDELNLAIQLSANVEAQRVEKIDTIEKEKALLQYDSKLPDINPDKLMGSVGGLLQKIPFTEDFDTYLTTLPEDKQIEARIHFLSQELSKQYGYPYPIAKVLVTNIISITELDENDIQFIKRTHEIARSRTVHDINNFFKEAQEHANNKFLFIVSVGSGSSSDQQVPQFAMEAEKQVYQVAILNVDPGFNHLHNIPVLEIAEKINNKNIHPFYLHEMFPDNREPEHHFEVYKENIEQMMQKGAKIVLIQNAWPRLPMLFNDLAKSQASEVGQNLAVIGSYHDHQPSFVYNQLYFDLPAEQKQKERAGLIKIWQLAISLEDYAKKHDTSITKLKEENIAIGLLLEYLSQVPIDSLFKHEKSAKLTLK